MITWINCAERIPPDDEVVIVKSWTGRILKITKYALSSSTSIYGEENYNWTPYTEEAWSELNK